METGSSENLTMDGRYLLKISNDTRAAIRETKSLGRRGPDFNNVLTELHNAEMDGRHIDLETIQHTQYVIAEFILPYSGCLRSTARYLCSLDTMKLLTPPFKVLTDSAS